MSSTPAPQGLFASLRRLLATSLGITRVRLELFGSELEAEKLRIFDALVRAAVGLMLIALALVLALVFLVMLFQDGYRLPALGVLALASAGGGLWLLGRGRSALEADAGGPFALTLGELQRDLDSLQAAAASLAAKSGPAAPPPSAAPPRPPGSPAP